MHIASISVGEREEQIIDAVYRRLKESFPLAEYMERDNILGIGEPGKHLMCYVFPSGEGYRFKFKRQKSVPLADESELLVLADETVRLFRENSFELKQPGTYTRKAKSSESSVNLPEDEADRAILSELGTLFRSMPDSALDQSFESCSTRLFNCLYRLGILTVRDLSAYTPEQIWSAKQFGRKCLWELHDFLMRAAGREAPDPAVSPEPRFEEIDYMTASSHLRAYHSQFEAIYPACVDCVVKLVDLKLKKREKAVVYERLGIFETAKTLQAIGNSMGLTRERIRQIYSAACDKLLHTKLPLSLREEIIGLSVQAANLSAGGFLAFIYIEGCGLNLAEFVCKRFFRQAFDRRRFAMTVQVRLRVEKRDADVAQKREKFNSEMERLIVYPQRKAMSEEAFRQLKTERDVRPENEELAAFEYGGRSYACESLLEQMMLTRFLSNGTFREIKTQSLKIPFRNWYYYPDFQCLTHDGAMVIVEIKPILKMLSYTNIEKFRALRAYCAERGYGYLIVDNKYNSFDSINEHNPEFEERVMRELEKRPVLKYPRFHELYCETNATVHNFLTLIKTQNLELRTPFSLRKHRVRKPPQES